MVSDGCLKEWKAREIAEALRGARRTLAKLDAEPMLS